MTKLVYFDAYGFAEPVRIALNLAKIEFEDVRIQREDWPAYKTEHADELEFGQVPVLYHNGKQINQSAAILRYVGHVTGFYPTDAYTAWRVDSFLDAFRDLQVSMGAVRYAQDEAKKKELAQAFITTTLPTSLERFEKRLAANTSQNYLVGDSLTIADIQLLSGLHSYILNEKFEMAGDLKSIAITFPHLAAYAKFHSETTLKEYLATRPQCAM